MKKRGNGCIINIASVAGKNGAAGLSHYCGSKFAVVGFTNSLAKELASANIRANAICPGILRTQMWEYLAETMKGEGETKEDAWQRYIHALIPMGRPQSARLVPNFSELLSALVGQATPYQRQSLFTSHWKPYEETECTTVSVHKRCQPLKFAPASL